MKRILFFMLILSLIWGCKKDEAGSLNCTIKFSNSTNKSMGVNKPLDGDSLYTQFGDYIISLTPTRYIGDIMMVRFYPEGTWNLPTAMTLIGGDPAEPFRRVDFSNNEIVNVIPNIMGGTSGEDPNEMIKFVILEFTTSNFYQEVVLPTQYTNVNLSQFNFTWNGQIYTSDSVKNGNILFVDNHPILATIFDLSTTGMLSKFIFGRTDTTKLCYNPTNQPIPGLEPINSFGISGGFFLWSKEYNEWSVNNNPPAGVTTNIYTTICIDTHNLIQVYAGADNVPYTSDDIITYAPKYWDRIKVSVTVN